MKIFLDPVIFNMQKYGGVSRYYTEIFSVISKKKNIEVVLPVYHSENVYINESPLQPKDKLMKLLFKGLSFIKISTRSLRKKKGEKLLTQALKNSEFDLFVPTYYNTYFLNFIHPKPFVLTVYDMIHELFPQYFTDDSFNVVQNKLLLMEKATMIIAVSQNTKKDILTIYPHIDESKIEVIYHGTSVKIDDTVKADLPVNYILFVGTRDNYKNFIFLLKSMTQLFKNNPGLTLICAGGGVFKTEEINLMKELGIENKVIHRNFEEKELGQFYKNAKCFVFPSMYEGFGIPVLEAMACGCPVVLAKNSSFPEVAGDAGVYFDVNSPEDLKNKIEMILLNEEVRKDFSAKGLNQVKKFDWNNAAEQCLNVYKRAIQKAAQSETV